MRFEEAIRLAAIAAAVLVGAAASAYADDEGDPEQHCGQSTPEIVECLKVQTAQWDKRLNAAYKKALEAAQRRQREQLRVAQRLWIQFRDANCLYVDLGEGTIARIEAGECMLRMTKGRALELEGEDDRK